MWGSILEVVKQAAARVVGLFLVAMMRLCVQKHILSRRDLELVQGDVTRASDEDPSLFLSFVDYIEDIHSVRRECE